ncbi:hypothetical protein BH23ACT10_BH23ACT10_11570 [soil metagenome]
MMALGDVHLALGEYLASPVGAQMRAALDEVYDSDDQH